MALFNFGKKKKEEKENNSPLSDLKNPFKDLKGEEVVSPVKSEPSPSQNMESVKEVDPFDLVPDQPFKKSSDAVDRLTKVEDELKNLSAKLSSLVSELELIRGMMK